MKMHIWRVTAKGNDNDPQEEPFGFRTRWEDEGATQEVIEMRVLEELRRRLDALTNGAANKVEVTIQLIDEE